MDRSDILVPIQRKTYIFKSFHRINATGTNNKSVTTMVVSIQLLSRTKEHNFPCLHCGGYQVKPRNSSNTAMFQKKYLTHKLLNKDVDNNAYSSGTLLDIYGSYYFASSYHFLRIRRGLKPHLSCDFKI